MAAASDRAVGYLPKDRVTDIDTVLDALERVAAGGTASTPKPSHRSSPATAGTPALPV